MTVTYSNPRMFFTTDEWPYGRNRTTVEFIVQQTPRFGERVSRRTRNPRTGNWMKPKTTTYAQQARIVDGDDGKTYVIERTRYGHITVMQGTMKYQQEVLYPDNPLYQSVLDLFRQPTEEKCP